VDGEELDEELVDEDLVDDEIDEDVLPTDDDAAEPAVVEEDEEEVDVPAARRKATTADDDDDEDEPDDRTDPDSTERVAAKSAEEFTCTTCFMIVHPRQFGRLGRLVCPEGYDPCSSIPIVEKRLKKAAKK